MNSWMLSPSIDARKASPNFCISFCAVTSPMVGIRFSALSTVEDWSLADRPLGRINDHSGARQWLHLRRDSSASSSVRSASEKASRRSEEHTSQLQSLMRISYAVFCLKKKKNN